MKKIILTSLILCLAWFAGAQSGSVTATSVAQRTDGSGLVDVYFNLSGDGTNYFIKLDVSFNAGSSYSAVNSSYTSGDIGPVNPGTNKHIVWNALHSHPNQNTANAKLQITATTGVFPNSGQSCPGIPDRKSVV